MNAVWQVQEAKNRFSEVIDRALKEGPQTVTRHGRPVVRIVPVLDASEVGAPSDDGFAAYLLASPRLAELELAPQRSRKSAPVLGG